ncbi:hypothetical protein GCM10027168_37850 [Streptomyces capparidis]
MPTTSTTMTPSDHMVERTVRIFVHSEASACPRWVGRAGIGEVKTGWAGGWGGPAGPWAGGAAGAGYGFTVTTRSRAW